MIADHHTGHRPRKDDQQPAETPQSLLVGAEVGHRIHTDRHTDDRDQREHDRRERIDSQVERQAERGNPLDALGDRAAISPIDDRADVGDPPHDRGQGGCTPNGERTATHTVASGDQSGSEEQVHDDKSCDHDV